MHRMRLFVALTAASLGSCNTNHSGAASWASDAIALSHSAPDQFVLRLWDGSWAADEAKFRATKDVVLGCKEEVLGDLVLFACSPRWAGLDYLPELLRALGERFDGQAPQRVADAVSGIHDWSRWAPIASVSAWQEAAEAAEPVVAVMGLVGWAQSTKNNHAVSARADDVAGQLLRGEMVLDDGKDSGSKVVIRFHSACVKRLAIVCLQLAGRPSADVQAVLLAVPIQK